MKVSQRKLPKSLFRQNIPYTSFERLQCRTISAPSITSTYESHLISTNQRGPIKARPHHPSPKMSVAPMLNMSINTSNTSLARHLDNPVPLPNLGLGTPAPPKSLGLDKSIPPSFGLDNWLLLPNFDLVNVNFDNDIAIPITHSNTPELHIRDNNKNDKDNDNKKIVILGPVSAGTIAQRRALARAIRSLAQRQLRSQFSTTSLSHRLEQQRESSRTRHRSPSRSRDVQLQRSHEGSAIALRRCQNRALRSKRRASSRLGHGHSLAPPGHVAGGGDAQRVLVKKASKIGSEMMFFGEFKANPGRQWFNGCVVS